MLCALWLVQQHPQPQMPVAPSLPTATAKYTSRHGQVAPGGGGRIAPVEPLGLGDKWTSMGTTMQTLSCLPGLPKTMGCGELSFCHMLPHSS